MGHELIKALKMDWLNSELQTTNSELITECNKERQK
jgi:hypothetical protein